MHRVDSRRAICPYIGLNNIEAISIAWGN